ncbi:hypothetical protein L6162_25680, partial [Escherichia coli]|nr:hypothetical protein [Escherichia coli]
MIQTRNQYLQFMLVMLAAWGISWGARFVMEQAVLLYGSGKNYLFFSHGTVLMYLLCVFLVYRRWHCCKVSDEAAFCLIQRPYISKTLLTRRISP